MEIKLKEVLNRELKAKGVSLNQVSRKTKIALSTLHGWSQGILPNSKNLHQIKVLSDYFQIPFSTMLFNVREESSKRSILFSSEFVDGAKRYRLVIEKIED